MYVLKAYLSSQPSSLSYFMISKAHVVTQKPCKRQLNTKVCGIAEVQFISFYLFQTTVFKQWQLEVFIIILA